MDWKTFIVSIIDVIAWPILIWYFIYEFKDKIMDFIYRIKKVKHKDTEIELFAQEIQELKEKSISSTKPDIEEYEVKEKYDFLIKLANVSPRSAIIESFITVESSINKAIAKLNLDDQRLMSRAPIQKIRILEENNLLNKNQYYQLQKLRDLRNKASHLEDFELEDMPIEAYIDIALTLSNYLDAQNL